MLTVDDGRIERKNPDAIVKVVPDSVLGGGVFMTDSVQSIRHALLTCKALSSTGAIPQRARPPALRIAAANAGNPPCGSRLSGVVDVSRPVRRRRCRPSRPSAYL
ncbi:MAG: hypothetical protein V8Q79_07605 [Christensenellales bacterium]